MESEPDDRGLPIQTAPANQLRRVSHPFSEARDSNFNPETRMPLVPNGAPLRFQLQRLNWSIHFSARFGTELGDEHSPEPEPGF